MTSPATPPGPGPRVIPQWIDGIQYRSSLEARWAIFFREAGIRAEYEPEGFDLDGHWYRPDFLLRDCGTWVEVKGDPGRLDMHLMARAAAELPRYEPRHERGPRMLILGPLPVPLPDGHENGDWGWIGIHPDLNPCPLDVHSLPGHPGYTCPELLADRYGFGMYHKNLRPWWLGAESHPAEPCTWALASELPARHVLDPWFDPAAYGIPEAYAAARAHRFGR